jgi:hypothetical protein
MAFVTRVFPLRPPLQPKPQLLPRPKGRGPEPPSRPPENEYSDVEIDPSSDDPEALQASDFPVLDQSDLRKAPRYALSIFSVARHEFSAQSSTPLSISSRQTAITFEHREIAITHMLSVQQQYAIASETLFQAVGYLHPLLGVMDSRSLRRASA